MEGEEGWRGLEKCPQLNRGLTRYGQKTAFQLSQIAACNRLHDIEPRLARWLLMTQDRVGSDKLPLTHHFLHSLSTAPRHPIFTHISKVSQPQGLGKFENRLVAWDKDKARTDSMKDCNDGPPKA